jgi:hypothetical protein
MKKFHYFLTNKKYKQSFENIFFFFNIKRNLNFISQCHYLGNTSKSFFLPQKQGKKKLELHDCILIVHLVAVKVRVWSLV